ncbi:MAG: sugar phosphate isomerase/epimerase family protein [Bacillota bacterium]|nr:sugar phosphate isomerase/epimerase family protein [Bacillota bacterium]
MKFALSTLGCPSWSWGEVMAAAHDLGYDGIEIRGLGQELYAPAIELFSPANSAATLRRLDELDLRLSCLTSAVYLFDKTDGDVRRYGEEYVDTAARMQAPYIRVLGDLAAAPREGVEIDIDLVTENLRHLAVYARGKGVRVLLETNGVFADTTLINSVMQAVNEAQAGILWDVHHPYRYFGETVEHSYANVREYLGYLHMKDSVATAEGVVYKMMGFGDVPNEQVLTLLQRDGFDGYISLEWLKRWNKSLSEPGIVFPHFINYVRDFLG